MEKNELKDNILCLDDNLEATGWSVFVTRERVSQRSEQEGCFTVEEKCLSSVQQKSLEISMKHIFIHVPLRFGHLCNWKTHQP